VTEQEEQKPGEYLIGLTLGTLVAVGAWFLYKTKKGERLRSWWDKYFSQIQDEWAKLRATEGEIVKKPSSPRLRRAKVKKHTFHHSGQPLVK